jgi:hypothetical protein
MGVLPFLLRFEGPSGHSPLAIDHSLNHRLERAVEQHLHEAVGRVVAARGLARVALGLASRRERELATVLGDLGDQLEQALVDATELLGAHVAPVDAREARVLAQPRELEHREQERAVLELGCIERGTLRIGEDAGERGQSEPRLAALDAAEDNLSPLLNPRPLAV